MHHIVHPIIENRKDEILCCNLADLDIDTSYYLNNDEAGILNAFEEYMVRTLTDNLQIRLSVVMFPRLWICFLIRRSIN